MKKNYRKIWQSYTTRRTYGKEVTVDSTTTDRYGRVVGFVILQNGDTLNHELLRNGWAWQYTKYDTNTYRQHLQNTAHDKHLGLWKRHATPPWEWR